MAKHKSKLKICDDLWKLVIRKRANNHCEYCNVYRPKNLHTHHIIPRTCYPLRHDIENGIALCLRHHLYYAHKDMIGFYNFIKDKRDLDYLESRRHSQTKNDYEMIRIYLESVLSQNKGELK